MHEGTPLELLEAELGPTPAGTPLLAVHAPGRTEVAGNHTDHEGGRVIAATVDVSVEGVARANGTGELRVASAGYPTFAIALDDLAPRADERVSTAALARGMAACMERTGRVAQGFDLALTCTIPAGGGLSSSAAVEAALGRAMEALWEGPAVAPATLARMGQFAESEYFGKPCGLMDQLSICLGGLALMDFRDPEHPGATTLGHELDLEAAGYALVLVDVGCDHSAFTSDYAAVPAEMQAVARALGKTRLCEVDRAEFEARVPELRETLGDRAVLRAIHYWRESELVGLRWDALQASDVERFLALTRESGASSAMFLQNVSTGGAYQPAMLALGLAESLLAGRGAARIHGGGFGGSIQAFVPLDRADAFQARMDAWLGEGACRRHAITPRGACAWWM